MSRKYSRVVGTMLPSDSNVYSLDRYSGPANPVGHPGQITRETFPVSSGAGPRMQHPKLATKPWSSSYAQKRSEPTSVKKTRWSKLKGQKQK